MQLRSSVCPESTTFLWIDVRFWEKGLDIKMTSWTIFILASALSGTFS